MKTGKSCKTCRYLDVPLNAAGRRVVRKDSPYDCIAPFPKEPVAPDSITSWGVWKDAFNQGHKTRWMFGSEGENCPVWTPSIYVPEDSK